MRPLLAALLLFPAVGFGQSIALTVNGAGTSSSLARNSSGCGTIVAGTWSGTTLTGACTSLQIWLSTNTCGTTPSTTNVPPDFVVATVASGDLTTGGVTSGTFSFNFNSLPSFATSACGSVVDFTNNLCAAVTLNDTTGACSGTNVQAPSFTIRYDNVPPLPPTVTVTPLDTQLSVRLASSDTTDTIQSFQLQVAVEPPDGGTPSFGFVGGTIPVNNPSYTISGLVNGTNYLVQGYSVDEATNVSPASAQVVGTPVLTLGFYANYINDGGQPGGCGDAAGGEPSALALATVLLFGLVRRRG
jgi:hypothetical protein